MLEGTDLSSAYSSIINQQEHGFDQAGSGSGSGGYSSSFGQMEDAREVDIPKSQPKQQSRQQPENAITQQLQAIQTIANAQYQKGPTQKPPAQQQQAQQQQAQQQYDMSTFNKQFDQDQRIHTLVNELKKQKQQQAQQQVAYQQPMYYEESYWDKMANKKKDIFKFIQSGLIILFAISLHVVIDFVLKHYLQIHDISYNREVMIRVLYPLGILFIAWNIIAFMK
jgi:hypothetical protein